MPAWLSQLAFLTLYFSVRLQTDWLGPRAERSEQDAIGVLVLSFLFLGLHTAVRRAGVEAFRTPTRFAALVLPVLCVALLGHQASHFNAAMRSDAAARVVSSDSAISFPMLDVPG